MNNQIKHSLKKINMPESRQDVVLKDILNKVHRVQLKDNKNMKYKWIYAAAGLAVTACIALFAIFLPQMNQTPNIQEIPKTNPTKPVKTAKLPEANIPIAQNLDYGIQLCSYAVAKGEDIYFSNPEDNDRLYVMKADGSGKTRLTETSAKDIVVVGDFIYYISLTKTGLSNFEFHGVCAMNTKEFKEIVLYKTQPEEGQEYTNVTNLCLDGNKLYFRIFGDDKKNKGEYEDYAPISDLYQINTDGTDLKKLDIKNISYLHIKDGWIYYTSSLLEESYGIYRQRIDGGTHKQKIADECYPWFSISDDKIYYTCVTFYDKRTGERVLPTDYLNEDGEISDMIMREKTNDKPMFYQMDLDGSNRIMLADFTVNYFVVSEDLVLFSGYQTSEYTTNGNLYSIKTDGCGLRKLIDNEYIVIEGVVGDYVYFSKEISRKIQLYKMRLDGTERQEVNIFEI